MTTTLANVRDRLRVRLEDGSASPLWADATRDEGLRRSLGEYSQWSPEQSVDTFTAAAGDLAADLPIADPLRVVTVIDPNGWAIPPTDGPGLRYRGDVELSWSIWGGQLRFTRQLVAGEYTVWSSIVRTWPATDATAFPVPDADLDLIIAGAAVYALEVRGTQEWKRGPLPARYSDALNAARAAYSAAWRERRRRVRTGTLGSTQ
jgi:hypothetical protein